MITEIFSDSFKNKKEESLVLYGTGLNTGQILKKCPDWNIVGLMDHAKTGEEIYGKKVLSEEEVIALSPIIVIIARDSVISIIFRRIKHLFTIHGISIFDLYGNELNQQMISSYSTDLHFWKIRKEDLRRKIDDYSLISFDLFDTLIARKTNSPQDVFRVMEEKLSTEGLNIDFLKNRMMAEKMAKRNADIYSIYEVLKDLTGISDEEKNKLLKLEIETEQSLIYPREAVWEALNYALENRKEAVILSDMYFSEKILLSLLKCLNIEYRGRILVSCEINANKEEGTAFEYLKKYAKKKGIEAGNILHIGDNQRCDIDHAKQHGIESFWIPSVNELLSFSSINGLLVNQVDFYASVHLGLLKRKLFENPFSLCKTSGKVEIKDPFDLGYVIFGPFFSEFSIWFMKELENDGADYVLFPSRDGFLIKKIYDRLRKAFFPTLPSGFYFKTSRRAVTLASIRNKQDLTDLIDQSMKDRPFVGSNKEMLKKRFGVESRGYDSRDNQTASDVISRKKYCMRFLNEILIEASKERAEYLSYLEAALPEINESKKTAFFDFVSGGTSQYYLSKLLRKRLKGYYCATLDLPNTLYAADRKEVKSWFGNITYYNNKSEFGKNFLILESILTDGDSTLIRFKDGEPVFEKEMEVDKNAMFHLQNGILAYIDDILRLGISFDNHASDEKKSDEILGLLFQERVEISEELKSIFVNEDSYTGIKSFLGV